MNTSLKNAAAQVQPARQSQPARRRRLAAAATSFALGLLAVPGIAQAADTWPSRPVVVISPYPPGGTNDVVARAVADRLGQLLGQPFVVENRAGAAGILGTSGVVRAAADGYTLLSANNGALVVQSVVKSHSPYDPARDLTAIAKFADSPNFIGVSASLPVSNVSELIALARRQPGQLNYGSSGSGSFGNFSGELFKAETGVDIVHVPFRGSAAAVTDLAAGRVQVMFDPLVLPQAGAGKIKVLAALTHHRTAGQPDIPTVKEAGGPDFELKGWFGLFGPRGLPKEVVDKLAAAAEKIAAEAELKAQFLRAGLEPTYAGPAAFSAIVRDDLARYADIKQRARIEQVE